MKRKIRPSYLFTLFLVFILLIAAHLTASAEMTEEWVARYNGPGDGWDTAYAVAVGGPGNVYVTGTSRGSGTNADYATVKYGTDGNQLWEARYNGPGNDPDAASAMDTGDE